MSQAPQARGLDRALLERAIERVRQRRVFIHQRTPWVVMHGLLAFGREFQVFEGQTPKDAASYLLREATFEGARIYRKVNGQVKLRTRSKRERYYLVQDHADQFLSAYALAGLPLSSEIVVDGERRYSIADALADAQRDFLADQELGWSLVAFAAYVGPTATWSTGAGERMGLKEVLALALARDATKEAEQGSHHLFGVAYALKSYQARGGALTGVWAQARDYLDQHVRLAKTAHRRAKAAAAKAVDIHQLGHQLEWLTVALEPRQLQERWVQELAEQLANALLETKLYRLSDGAMYHAAGALRRYRAAVFPKPTR